MILMNMSFSMLYLGWLNYLLIVLLPVMIFSTIILYPVFCVNPGIIIIFIIMYNILSTLFMLTVGTFFHHCKLKHEKVAFTNDGANIFL